MKEIFTAKENFFAIFIHKLTICLATHICKTYASFETYFGSCIALHPGIAKCMPLADFHSKRKNVCRIYTTKGQVSEKTTRVFFLKNRFHTSQVGIHSNH